MLLAESQNPNPSQRPRLHLHLLPEHSLTLPRRHLQALLTIHLTHLLLSTTATRIPSAVLTVDEAVDSDSDVEEGVMAPIRHLQATTALGTSDH